MLSSLIVRVTHPRYIGRVLFTQTKKSLLEKKQEIILISVQHNLSQGSSFSGQIKAEPQPTTKTHLTGRGQQMSGRLSCVCGKCILQLANPKPRWRWQCGCCDCRQAMRWAFLQGGPPGSVTADGWYFDNDLTVVTGEDEMKWYKLREGGKARRMVTSCCHSTIIIHHPFYKNNVVAVNGAINMDVEDIECKARIQMKDFPRERIGEIEPLKGKPVDKENLDDYGDAESFEELFAKFGAVCGTKVEKMIGRSTGEFIDENQVICLGLKEADELI